MATLDKRISVIHAVENRGLSCTRNTGLEKVRGRYILFADSDDMLELGLFSTVYASLEKKPADLLIFGMVEDYYDRSGTCRRSYPVCYPDRYFTDKNSLRREMIYIEKSTLLGYAWNKFYSVEFLRKNQLKFETITLIEDIVFNIKVFQQLASLSIISFIGYHYNKSVNGSLTDKFVPEYFSLHRKRIFLLYDAYCQWNLINSEVLGILGGNYVRYIFSALQRNCDKRAHLAHHDRKLWLKELYGQELFQLLIPEARPESGIALVMCDLLKKKRIMLTLIAARLMFFVKNKMPMFFSGIKRND